MRLWDAYVNLREFNTSFSFFFFSCSFHRVNTHAEVVCACRGDLSDEVWWGNDIFNMKDWLEDNRSSLKSKATVNFSTLTASESQTIKWGSHAQMSHAEEIKGVCSL